MLLAMLVPAIATLLQRPRQGGSAWQLTQSPLFQPVVTAVLIVGVILVIFASPGTSLNHLLDLQLIAWICVVAAFGMGRNVTRSIGLATVCLIGVGTIWLETGHIGRMDVTPKQEMAKALATVGPGEKPILAENPTVLQLGGERVYMLDSFMFRIAGKKDPSLVERLKNELKTQKFRGVILMADPRTRTGKYIIERTHFYPGFCNDVLESYDVAYETFEHVALVPRNLRQAGQSESK